MVTKEQAIMAGEAFGSTEFHYGECKKVAGPRGGIKITQIRVRSNGKCKTWVTRPDEFSLPYTYGLYAHGYIDHTNCNQFHLNSECPLNEK